MHIHLCIHYASPVDSQVMELRDSPLYGNKYAHHAVLVLQRSICE